MRAYLHQAKEGGGSEKWEFRGRDHYIGVFNTAEQNSPCYDEKEVVTNLFFCTVAYIQV